MNENIKTVIEYHQNTKHHYNRYAKSLGYMDWANQPDPFRTYSGAKEVLLPLSLDNPTPPYHLLFTQELPSAPLLLQSLSQLLQFSMGISAIKSNGYDEWALRCNASSGNLHPSEVYLILPPLEDVNEQSTICHYSSKSHSLEILNSFDSHMWEKLPQGTFFISVDSIVYREVWKYGERAFRYTQLDAGHALRSIAISAKTLGWQEQILYDISDEEISHLFGFNQSERFEKNEIEIPDMLLMISPKHQEDIAIPVTDILNSLKPFDSYANILTSNHQEWPIISQIEKVTASTGEKNRYSFSGKSNFRKPTKEAKDVILNRRSAQMMNRENSQISFEEFITLLQSTQESFCHIPNRVNLVLFVHNVATLPTGLYLYLRDHPALKNLQSSLHESFEFKEIDSNLFLLREGDYKYVSKAISCTQDIACDGAFSLGMLAPFHDEILSYGAQRYKQLYWECGAIGQQLYLEATSLGLSATGIGCFLDDAFHELIGLDSDNYQSLYHFTIGRALRDSRILSLKPYEGRE